jgi:hypothetical protein
MPELAYGAMPVPATPIGALSQWQLDIRCSRCRRHVPLRILDLIEPYGQKIRIAEVVRRLRCGGLREGKLCGARPAQVVLIEVAHGRRVREITVIGHRG